MKFFSKNVYNLAEKTDVAPFLCLFFRTLCVLENVVVLLVFRQLAPSLMRRDVGAPRAGAQLPPKNSFWGKTRATASVADLERRERERED